MRFGIGKKSYRDKTTFPSIALGGFMMLIGLLLSGPKWGPLFLLMGIAVLSFLEYVLGVLFFNPFWPTLQQAVEAIWDDKRLEAFYAANPKLAESFGSKEKFVEYWKSQREQIRHTLPQPLPGHFKCGFANPLCEVFSQRETAGHKSPKIGNVVGLKLENGRFLIMRFNHDFYPIDFRVGLTKE